MPTAAERQALAFLAGVALLGGGARVWMQHQQRMPSADSAVHAASVDGQLDAVDAARSAKRSKKSAPKPVRKSSKTAAAAKKTPVVPSIVDVDVATAEELETLPRVGPALAARIVANRDSLGAFGSLTALGTVRGIGPAMLRTLEPTVTFSGRPRAIPEKSAKKRR
jgi:competence protein ComEA